MTNKVSPIQSTRSLSDSRQDSSQPNDHRRACVLLIAFTVLKFIFFIMAPMDLAGDEAYYWEWGQHLDWGYFSKPPGIAWIMALVDKIAPGSTLAIRTTALLMSVAGFWMIHNLVSRAFSPRTGWWTLLLMLSTVGSAALSTILTIDAPLVLAWSGGMWALWGWQTASIQGQRSVHWQLNLVFFLLLGVLSKQMMLVFIPLAWCYMLLSSGWRQCAKQIGFWLVFLMPLIGLLPSLWWNQQNNWITFTHTLHHFQSDPGSWLRHAQTGSEFLLAQAGLVGLVLFPLLIMLIMRLVPRWKQLPWNLRFLMIFGGFPMIFFLGFAFTQRVNPNWPAAFMPACIALMGAAACQQCPPKLMGKRNWATWIHRGWQLNIILLILAHLLLLGFSNNWFPSFPGDPTARIRGWQRLAHDIGLYRHAARLAADCHYITVGHRFLTSELAFYLRGQPRVHRFLPPHDRPLSQHDFWPIPDIQQVKDSLIVIQGSKESVPEDLIEHFQTLRVITELNYSDGPSRYQQFTLLHGSGLISWPSNHFSQKTSR